MAINSLAGVNPTRIAYTSKGNPYVKSEKGKTVGTAAGLTAGIGAAVVGNSFIKKRLGMSYTNAIKGMFDWVKKGGTTGLMADIFSPKLSKIINFCNKSKILRAGFAGACIALPYLVLAGAGRLIGSGCDKIVDMANKRKANKLAEA